MVPKPKEEVRGGRTVYIAADGTVHSTPQEAVDASLNFEKASNTGAGCSQDPNNIPKKK